MFQRLSGHYGPSGWWPGIDGGKASPFEMIVGAILVQNVAWKNAERALRSLKQSRLLDPEAIRLAPNEEIEALIRPTGYFRQKTLKLKALVDHLHRQYDGRLEELLDRPLAELRTELLGLKGIGPETCDCILNYAAGYPVMAMDAYTRRIFSRLGLVTPDAAYDEMQELFHASLPEETEIRGEYHALIDILGSRVCLKRDPVCSQCPLYEICPRESVEVTR